MPLDVAVDGAVVDIDVVLIGDVHQLVARFDHAGPLRQRLEDHELGDGQRDVPAVPFHPVPGRVHGQPAAHDLGLLGRLVLAPAGRARISVRRSTARIRASSSRCEKGLAI